MMGDEIHVRNPKTGETFVFKEISDPIHVRQPDGSYRSYHDLPVWFMMLMIASLIVVLSIGFGVIFSTIIWASQNQLGCVLLAAQK